MTIEEVIANPSTENVSQFMNTLSSDKEKYVFYGHLLHKGVMTSEIHDLFADITYELEPFNIGG